MSYQIIDESGKGADFATNKGLANLRDSAGPALLKFLDTGEADAVLCEEVAKECKGISAQAYIADLLEGMKPPITLSH